MKRNLLILLLLLSLSAHALVVSVAGQGDLPQDEPMALTLSQPTPDLLTGQPVFTVEGTLICNTPLTVTVRRSQNGLNDEFCCAGQCTAGNGEEEEILSFTPDGMASWYLHYYPAAGSDVTVTYTFSDGPSERQMAVHYQYTVEALETLTDTPLTAKKYLRNGVVYIEYNNHIYPL